MRTIKFKAVIYDFDKNYVISSQSHIIREVTQIEWDLKTKEPVIWYGQGFVSNQFLLLKFTGLHDKNGKEIFEGDKVKAERSIGVVVFEEAKFKIKWINGNPEFYNDILSIHQDHLEIIGTIHDNPELLEVS